MVNPLRYRQPQNGRVFKEDGSTVNIANMTEDIHKALVVNKNAGVLINGNKYSDLGLAAEGLNIPAGATVAGPWVDNADWVRNILIFGQSDQNFEIQIFRRDKSGVGPGSIVAANIAATGSGWSNTVLTGANALVGYSFQLRIKNVGAVSNTFARLRAQLLG